MSARTAIHWPLVRYQGSRTKLHGTIWQNVSGPEERLTLTSRHGYMLIKVHPASVTPIEVPALTSDRAEALRWLLGGWDRVPAPRVVRWLIHRDLARLVGHRAELTELGRELADALIRY